MKHLHWGHLAFFLVAMVLVPAPSIQAQGQGVADSIQLFRDNCAVCHGENLEGDAQGPPLLGELQHGDSMANLVASIGDGYAATGMPSWADALTIAQIRNVALYILETRANVDYVTFNHDQPLVIPDEIIASNLHAFRLVTIAAGLDPLPFSIAPLPDGRILLTEKKFGVRIINPDGSKSDYITGTPRAWSDINTVASNGNERGLGWLFDIAIHPNYQENGWVYLYFGDRCSDCNAVSREAGQPVSMNKLVRGRIEDGAWVDEEVIWEANIEHYSTMIDVIAGGCIDFDDSGHVFLSVGAKGPDNFEGIQDLDTPWGKIHRINDDGSIPADNPFAGRDDVYRSIYTYGHRSPQGLFWDRSNGQLWSTEHGQRGGDEVNLLLPGQNYGWPLYSLGMKYDGTPVAQGPELGIVFELADIQQPVVDLTPSPAVSSLIVSSSDQFPAWRNDFLKGSLKARSLFRFRIQNNRLVERETLLEGLARIRDIEQGFDGAIYLLLEHATGARIVQLVPAG